MQGKAMTALPPYVESLGGGVHAIDTGFHRPRFDAAYLVVQDGRAAFVDTGTNHAVPRMLAALDALGLGTEDVDHVIPTHVHLDHAGGAGLLMQHLPRATLVVHPRGARHMADPSALYAGALAIYGQAEMDRSYGRLVPVAADRIETSADDQVLELAGRPLRFADTPGHARHHHCIWDEVTRGWFTGDTFGLSYREFDNAAGEPWIMPTTTPVQFDPHALKASVRRLLSFNPACVYLTHYGRRGGVERLAGVLLDVVDAMVELGRRVRQAPDRHARLVEGLGALYRDALRSHGCTLADARIADLLALDLELNAQGLAIWLDRPPA
jgi:glyoxylase-like metal-dependent hydrolase (beta-lactamase superfamily II)